MKDLYCWKLRYKPCAYSNRLLEKLLLLNAKSKIKLEIEEVLKAIFYAKKYHADQKRQSGEPFYSHPIEVAYMVSDYLFTTDTIVVSILHDTLEDTELSFEMMGEIFGKAVANQVMDLTRIQKDGYKVSSARMVESLWLQKKYDLLLIKQFDRLHNIQTIGVKSPEKIKKIVSETLNSFIILSEYLKLPNISKEMQLLCTKVIEELESAQSLYTKFNFSFNDNYQPLSPIYQNELYLKYIP